MLWHLNINSARSHAKIFSESLARVPVNSKGRISGISILVEEFFRSIFWPMLQAGAAIKARIWSYVFMLTKEVAWTWCSSHTFKHCAWRAKNCHTHTGCYRVYCAGKTCLFPGQLYEISQSQKTPLFCAEKSLLSLFVFYTYELKDSFMSD